MRNIAGQARDAVVFLWNATEAHGFSSEGLRTSSLSRKTVSGFLEGHL